MMCNSCVFLTRYLQDNKIMLKCSNQNSCNGISNYIKERRLLGNARTNDCTTCKHRHKGLSSYCKDCQAALKNYTKYERG